MKPSYIYKHVVKITGGNIVIKKEMAANEANFERQPKTFQN